ncbi:hypothetical protein N7532_002676 [Penicillium argentinense]|uniref:P-loop containing nucleoside triphosphate hydrolase protein n=1 Tax=Penicillium argentinense TaxID=1131581 RepID=A0A9W9G108_9EURO|nr:uncharacterized protein N7532_002676 [Penicillium argentinense]KAJ5110031.1 hypothetical protein N7532_002676 [Penicillium argentinense]
MSREVDRLPEPKEIRRKKVIVASPSRSGTLGLYAAMKILGYRPYHLYECVCVQGSTHIKIFREAIIAQYNWLSGVKRLRKPDCEKWLADYDCIIEVPSYLGMDVIQSYIDDPEVKFILTERNPKNWALSFNNTAAKVAALATTFPVSILKYFHADLYHFFDVNVLVYRALSSNTKPGDAENEEMLCEYYSEYIKKAKATIPDDRLLLIKLEDEDGIDWDTICPFLGLPVPKEDYPDRHFPEKFAALLQEFLQPRVKAAMFRCVLLTVSLLGATGWAMVKYGPSLLPALPRFMFSPP